MGLNAVSLPFEYIPNPSTGRPLANAQIFVGIAGLDPEILANQLPVTARQEDGTELIIPQPINTTMGGIVEYNGSPVQLFVSSAYSIKILSALGGTQLYYNAYNNNVLDASQVIYEDINAAIRFGLVPFVNDYGADPTGLTLSDEAFEKARIKAVDGTIALSSGTFSISSGLIYSNRMLLIGTGPFASIIELNAAVNNDDVLTFLAAYSGIHNVQLKVKGPHTKNGLVIGSATTQPGRCSISNFYSGGMGQDGIHVVDGNLGSFHNVACVSNGRDGVHMGNTKANKNAWSQSGYFDMRGNGRDGLHIAPGVTPSDVNASKTNKFQLVSAQQNTGHGVYVGSRSNLIGVYSEANGGAEVFLDTNAYGNEITTVEGSDVQDMGSFNQINTFSLNADFKRGFKSRVELSGGTDKGLRINADDDTTGEISFLKTAERVFKLICAGSANNMSLFFEHINPLFALNCFFSNYYGRAISTPITFANGDTSPSVKTGNNFICSNTAPTSITIFDDIESGQEIKILFTNANTTIIDSAGLQLAGGVNFVSSNNAVLTLIRLGNNTYEQSRSLN